MTERSSSLVEEISLNELIARQHAAFLTLPEVLCPESRPSSPTAEGRIEDMKTRITAAVNTAGGDPTNPKWGYVSRLVCLGSTSRKYVGVAPGVRIGDGKKVNVGKNFKFELPETEEEWAAYEQRWEAAVAEERRKSETKIAAKASLTSKYFKSTAAEEPEIGSRPRATSSKAEVIREKVERWQAQVATVVTAPDVPPSQEPVSSPPSPKVDKGKAKERVLQGEKVQASLGFRVVKRSSVTSAKGGSSGSSKPRVSPAGRVPTPPGEDPSPPLPDVPQEPVADELVERPQVSEPPPVPKITEYRDMSFLPPSFPSQLQTSTPPLNDRRQKPPPIAPCSPPQSSPSRLSVQSFDPSRPQRHAPQEPFSSLPAVSPVRRPLKRARTPIPSPEDVRMGTSPSRSPRLKSPLNKKARVDAPAVSEQDPVSSGPVPVPPSTPPPSSPPHQPVTPVSRGKGLGNAKGLPVPSTPDRHPLPTLTELLASSRRSRTRPRPPSRKNTPHSKAGSRGPDRVPEHELELPVVAENDDEHSAREHTPEPSPSKTYFSSPASGSSDSPGSVAQRARSPVSPLFAQHPSPFLPKYVSTQQPNGNTDDPFAGGFAQTQGSVMRGGSGFFGMGYSSQFDLEGHVEQVNELLERDVDFNGWIRDFGEEGEDNDANMSAGPSQSQDNGAIGVEGF
ncbi:hypothetical protein L226DRAFT_491777 [Lentinus tigrinus ALCF2SS1-7]|uniref:Uncharacterized protein n=1 Tax=Lentinus tigrinus ALCF2SS1-6 TaxID=1328759 RepID=A0A5C2RWI5_9APHY|nr:hypothetical protein L227DRAFT_533307 [Lentinus tigrinus ALCF2SS1-6]RPD71272.1 hypothetical protein L226DRAFT_491777 [Lentinus tigrinus ALCF2SS1-7]